MNTNAVTAGELDRAQHQHLRPGCGHLEHLLVRDRRQLARVRHDARVGGEDAGDVGVDLAGGAERGRERDGGRVRAAAAERRDLHRVAREALEAGDEHDLALVERVLDPVAPDLADLGLHVRGVGEDAGLRARQRDRLLAEVVDRHRDERARDPLPGREQHVELPHVRRRRDLMGEIDQPVGRLAHRRDGADDPQAALLGVDEPPRDVPDLVRVGDRRAAELHHDGVEVHGRSLPPGPRSRWLRPTRCRRCRRGGLRRPAYDRPVTSEPESPGPDQPRPLQRRARAAPRARQGAGAARGRELLLARHPRPGGSRPRDPARGVRLPPAVARGLVAVRPAAEDRRLRRLRLPRRLRRLERRGHGRARRGALLLLRPLPDHAAPRRGAVARRRCASATSSGTRPSTIRRGCCTRSSTVSSTASSRASPRSTTGSTCSRRGSSATPAKPSCRRSSR